MLSADIIEIVGKTRKDFTLSLSAEDGTQISHNKFQGHTVWEDLALYIHQHREAIDSVQRLTVYCKSIPKYINEFKNITELHLSIDCDFTLFLPLQKLHTLHINRVSKSISLQNISSLPALRHLYIGDWSIGMVIRLATLDEICKCRNLDTLYLGSDYFPNGEIRKLAVLQNLKSLALSQTITTEDLAYLSVMLPNTHSLEFQAYQADPRDNTQVKINGRRKPFLKIEEHKSRINKYVSEFEKLRSSFLPPA